MNATNLTDFICRKSVRTYLSSNTSKFNLVAWIQLRIALRNQHEYEIRISYPEVPNMSFQSLFQCQFLQILPRTPQEDAFKAFSIDLTTNYQCEIYILGQDNQQANRQEHQAAHFSCSLNHL